MEGAKLSRKLLNKDINKMKSSLLHIIGLFIAMSTTPSFAGPYNQNTDWFKDAKYGLFVQWLYGDNDIKGNWDALVNGFDVNAFANQVEQTGAKYVTFTIGQGHKEWVAPSTIYDNFRPRKSLR